MKLEITKSGLNKVGMWCIGTITTTDIEYYGLFNFDKEYKIVDGSIYEIKKLKCRLDKKGILRITIAL